MIAVVTLPHFFPEEVDAIKRLLESGAVDRMHVRKPESTRLQMESLLDKIPAHLYPRLSLHDCHELARDRGCGVHLNGRHPSPPPAFDGIVSVSCHSTGELAGSRWADYRFISPIYPSISKPGYIPIFTLDSIRTVVDRRTIALGGVTPEKFAELATAGMGGAALSGHIWNGVERGEIETIINEIHKNKICFSL